MENKYSLINFADAELLDSYSRTITGVVGQVAEAVVHIQVMKPAASDHGPRPNGPARRSPGQRPQQEPEWMPASGSGFIISTDGFVVTNNHVIENAREIKVSLADGRTVKAELKG